ncbi:hypothetical protein MKX01_003211, partial [Papaver californicum]
MDILLPELPLKKIQELEAGDANLEEEEMEELILCGTSSRGITNDGEPKMGYSIQMSDSHLTQRPRLSSPTRKGGRGGQYGIPIACLSSFSPRDNRDNSIADPTSSLIQSVNCTNKQSLNMLQSMGQSINISDHNGLVAFWNSFSEHLYGYSSSEMLGLSALGPIIEERDFTEENEIISRSTSGECWTGQFHVRNKQGRRFQIIATHTPLYDDFGILVGLDCLGYDFHPFLEISPFSAGINLPSEAAYLSDIGIGPPKIGLTTTTGLPSQEKTLKDAIASNLTDL